jgi:hypothetical protein
MRKLSYEDIESELLSEPELRRQVYQLTDTQNRFNDHLMLLTHLYDVVNSQLSVRLAWKNREPTSKNEWGKKYDLFLEALEEFREAKKNYFKIIKEYSDSKRVRH